MTTFILSSLLIGLAVVGLGVSIFFSKKKKFLETHVGRNKAMRDRGINCVISADRAD
ncbi:MAG: hypothetical protein LBK12_08390 [Odoribacteraceae bacterium]|nr:hypothetical protein [Odoribacteraceae bacterium]